MRLSLTLPLLLVTACSDLEEVGKAPGFTQSTLGPEYQAMLTPPLPERLDTKQPGGEASLWSASQSSLLGNRRATQKGDILTVVIEINDSAQISNTSRRSRSGSEQMAVPQLFGVGIDPAVELSSGSSAQGAGSVSRNERVTLRVAATVLGVLPNGVMEIAGRQEVRVNFELRELIVTGFVRPEDVSRQNEVTYDKIASARIAYGGRGQISRVQQPRYGQQVADIVLPF